VAASSCCDDGISGAGHCCGCLVSSTRVSSLQQLQLVPWCPDVVQRPYCCLSGCRRWLLPAAMEVGAQAAAAAVVGGCLADVSPASSSCCWFTGAQMPCGGPTAACLAAAGCHKALGPRALVAGLLQAAWGQAAMVERNGVAKALLRVPEVSDVCCTPLTAVCKPTAAAATGAWGSLLLMVPWSLLSARFVL
jgi:hypothetical protein